MYIWWLWLWLALTIMLFIFFLMLLNITFPSYILSWFEIIFLYGMTQDRNPLFSPEEGSVVPIPFINWTKLHAVIDHISKYIGHFLCFLFYSLSLHIHQNHIVLITRLSKKCASLWKTKFVFLASCIPHGPHWWLSASEAYIFKNLFSGATVIECGSQIHCWLPKTWDGSAFLLQ